jgi:hypothetical protein
MAYTPNVTLINGGFTDFEGSPLNLGYLLMQISQDQQYTTGLNQIVAGLKLRINLDANGNIPVSPATKVFANDAMLPSGSFYTVRAFKADGTEAWAAPQFWTILSSPSTLDVGTIVPLNPPGSGGSGSSTLLLETNGVNNSNQSLLNIAQGTNMTITNVSGTTTFTASGGANFATAGQGFFYGLQDVLPIGDGSGTSALIKSTSNAVGVAQVNLDFAITISKIAIFVITDPGVAAVMYAAIYNAAGTTKLVEATGGFNMNLGSQVAASVTITPVTLQPGSYLFACGNTNGGSPGSVVGHGAYNAYFINSLLNVNATRVGLATNVIAAGAMPATLGSITAFTHADNSLSLPAVMFQA